MSSQTTASVSLEQAEARSPIPVWAAAMLSLLIVMAMAYVRLMIYPKQILPLTYGAALLICIWHRNIAILYLMAASFSAIAISKMLWRAHIGAMSDMGYEITAILMIMGSIWLEAAVIHGVIRARGIASARSAQLSEKNAALATSLHELRLHEAEIARQNEELKAQAEELEQQAEELRQQTEEMEIQRTELQTVNDELGRRERALRTLLDSARWLRSSLMEQDVMSAICRAAIEVTDRQVDAAAIVQEYDGRVLMRGHAGFVTHGSVDHDVDFSRSFASLVVESKQTAYIRDLSTREDLQTPHPMVGRPFQSVLASPIWSEGRVIGAIELYSRQAREWSEEEFSIAEWLAAQTALALQTIEYQKELEVKRREAEDASIQKTRFLAAVSHDVRTPANAISLIADLVDRMAADPSKAPQIPTMVKNLKANARALVELVSDVLDLARFDSGKLDVQTSDFSLAALVEVELRQFQQAAENRGLRLVNAANDPRLWVRTDKMKLARILANLVGNAVKFTEAGEIRVTATCTPAGAIHLAVSDTGVGIPAEHLPRIFDEFHQLQNPERDRNKGTGLGLAICRRLVDSLGCTLSVESTLGSGTTFTIRMPPELAIVGCDEPSSLPAVNKEDDGASMPLLQGIPILLVEDHGATRSAMASVLTSYGAVVSEAASCRSAIQLLAHEKPQVLLLDLMLPDSDGTEVLRHLQTTRPDSLKCILAVSGDVRSERVDDVLRLGANGLLPKPLTTESLIQAITSVLFAKPDDHFLDKLSRQVSQTDVAGGRDQP